MLEQFKISLVFGWYIIKMNNEIIEIKPKLKERDIITTLK